VAKPIRSVVEPNITVRVPIAFRRRGGRKTLAAPDGSPTFVPTRTIVDAALVKALARAFRWRKLMETGTCSTVDEIAAAEKLNDSYVSRILRLTLLAPFIVEVVLDGQQPAGVSLNRLMRPFPIEWEGQRCSLCEGRE